MKTDFRAWKQENLAKLAFDLSTKIADLEAELRYAQSDLKSALKAYREINKKEKNEQGS